MDQNEEEISREESIPVYEKILEKVKSQSDLLNENLNTVKQHVSQTVELFIKSTWILQVVIIFILFGSMIFAGIEGNNANVRNYDLYIRQTEFNKTFHVNRSITNYEKFYHRSLKAANLRCKVAKLDLYGWNSMNFTDAWMYTYGVISTTGWGIHCPQSNVGKLLTVIYATIGIPIIAALVGHIRNMMEALKEKKIKPSTFIRNWFGNHSIFAFMCFNFVIVFLFLESYLIKQLLHWYSYGIRDKLTKVGKSSEFNLTGCLYYLVINVLTTIGFGDQRWFSVGSRVDIIFFQMANVFLFVILLAFMHKYFLIVKSFFEKSMVRKFNSVYRNLTEK